MENAFAVMAILASVFWSTAVSKFYIESCSGEDKCKSLLGYRIVADTRISNVVAMFGVTTDEILGSNNYEVAIPEPDDVIIQAQELLRIPVSCACSNGIRRTDSIVYSVRQEGETLFSISNEVFGGMVTPLQIFQANSNDPGGDLSERGLNSSTEVAIGKRLLIPFPCACNAGNFKGIPAMFVSYMVQRGESTFEIASLFDSSVSSVVELNGMQKGSSLAAGDVLEVPIPACESSFDSRAVDYGLMVPNGTYTITADRCVQCSCNYPRLDCTPAPSSSGFPCPAPRCAGSNLKIGEFTTKASLQGCQVTSCSYNGFHDSVIFTGLENTNQSTCPVSSPPPTYRQYMPASTPDSSPIIEPQNIISNQVTPINAGTAQQSSSSFSSFHHIEKRLLVLTSLTLLLL
ncbi:lysM domain-containing GPI-anchored protein 2 [Selaginella moellendorffii]|uniref:lysM domain-containing GPI-anchored protein 2 n=1 Tax=Selaginella moellendorffii TaxID=88036 RepID=UPI000D1C56DC|nr:lysM domain-containing GPI-anchored protein 2 [Selaginella moellendorffii]|eukprot:XP_024540884.1 lysM domain-containing GPI-anchored protein 2 [Selaginella moellendorffii]